MWNRGIRDESSKIFSLSDAIILIFHRRSSGEKALARFHMSTDTSGPSPLAIVLSSKFHEKRS